MSAPPWALVLAVAACLGVAASASAAPAPAPRLLDLRDGAANAATGARITAVNAWWESANPDRRPCRKCEIRPPGSSLVWTYYRRQGFFPNWVRAARDLLRRERAGKLASFRAGVDEIVRFSSRRTSPSGVTYRINESPYLAPDSTPPPWRDAMGQGLILTLLAETLPQNPTAQELARARTLATEYLNSFLVHWSEGGIAAHGSAGGRWFLEYASAKGDRARVLNGFMQTLVSLDRFASQADALSADPGWAALRDRARGYVRDGALELDAHLDEYDYGKDQLSKYSLARPDPAPPVYQTYHRQLLLRLQDINYLPQDWRDHFSGMRVQWGGKPDPGWFRWWMAALALLAALIVALIVRRRRVVRRGSRPVLVHESV